MAEPLRVLQIVTQMDRGGLESFVMNMYRNIDRSRVQFDFLYHRNGRFAFDDEIEALGGHIYHVPRCNPLDLRYLLAIDRFFNSHRYKVVHSHIDCMSALPLAAARRHGAVMRIAHSHSSSQDHDLKYPIKLACKRLIRGEATDLFSCGVEAGKWMFNADDFTVIHNSIDVDSFAFDSCRRKDVRSALNIAPDVPVIGHVGRFVPTKNHMFVIEVFARLLIAHPGAILLLVGDGGLRPDVESYASRLGISSSVKFLGVRSDVSDLMQAMDVFILPSLYEGLPLVLVEAQASGLPCVISDSIPDDCDLVRSGIVRVLLSEPAVQWAKAVSRALRGTQRLNGASIVRGAGFDANETASWLESFYLRCLEITR